MIQMTRRQMLTATAMGAALAPLAKFTPSALAQTAPLSLTIEKRTLEVKGRPANVFAIRQPDGTSGIRANAGDRLRLKLHNKAGESSLIHWHGQTPPVAQDGVPGIGQDPVPDGQSWDYDYLLRSGTHWMHSHHGLQEQLLMAAPLIVREDPKADVQEVVMLLHDFSFTPPEELLAALQGASGGGGHGGHQMPMTMQGQSMVDHAAHMRQMAETSKAGAGHGMPFGHANDIDYDAYLANDRTLGDPEIVQVEKGGRVRLRLINGATTTAFTLDTGILTASILTVDGNPVRPVTGRSFPLAMGQRIDLLLDIPKEGGAFPILALRETAIERTGIILATPGAKVSKLADTGKAASALIGLGLESRLIAAEPLVERKPDRKLAVELGQAMGQYIWTLNNQVHGMDTPLKVKLGERVEITFLNHSMMMHPMHLHGHHFQVVAIGQKRVQGAVRDTVIVPSGMGAVTVAFDAVNPGRWPLHCHNLFHMAAGMMTTVDYV
ncbi:MAG: multicopper oxidase domain-containing protein [Alphaproteobacteria bacterium]|nr:multicopper oxidase domain-containing protein [Alphaproteobacteria bacterium]